MSVSCHPPEGAALRTDCGRAAAMSRNRLSGSEAVGSTRLPLGEGQGERLFPSL